MLCFLALLTPMTLVVATAWACAPNRQLTVEPSSGPPGTTVTVEGDGFGGSGAVTITGPGGMSASATPELGSFSVEMTLPDVPPGVYLLTAKMALAPDEPPAVVARVAIQVTDSTSPPPPPAVDDVITGPTQLVSTPAHLTHVDYAGVSRDGGRLWFTQSGRSAFEGAHSTTSWLSHLLAPVDDWVYFGAASQDGSRVFFMTTASLTSEDTDPFMDVYERSGAGTRLISKPADPGLASGAPAEFGGISEDGRRVFFMTTDGLTHDDGDFGRWDVYEHADGVTRLVSGPTGTPAPSTDRTRFVAASADGSHVFFTTYDRLTPDDTDVAQEDVYERVAGMTRLVTRGDDIPQVDDGFVRFAGVSRDGEHVLFETQAKMTDDDLDSGHSDVYERSGSDTTLVSKPTDVADPDSGDAFASAISDDGSRVFFGSAEELTAEDDDGASVDVFVRSGGVTTLVSQPAQNGLVTPSEHAFLSAITGDGSRVIFETTEKMTVDDTDTLRRDVYERAGAQTTLLSKPTGLLDPDTADATFRGMTDDGEHIFFDTNERLVADDGDDGRQDVYRRAGGRTSLISRPTGVPDPAGTTSASFVGVSAGGSIVFFRSEGRYTEDDLDDHFFDIFGVGIPDQPAGQPAQPGDQESAAAAQRLPSPTPSSSDTTRPRLTDLRARPRRIRRVARGRRTTGSTATQISFGLSEPARVTLAFARAEAGRRAGGRCTARTPGNRRGRRCIRYVLVAGTITRQAESGVNRLRLTARVGRTALAPGTYRITASAVDAAGNRSQKHHISLTVIAAKTQR